MTSERTALIIGATGGIGSEVATALIRRSWRLRADRPKSPSRRLGARGSNGSGGMPWCPPMSPPPLMDRN